MRIMILILIAAVHSLFSVAPTSAQMLDDCSHTPTIAALRTCIQHAINNGDINTVGVGRSLLTKLDTAQKSVDRGQPVAALNQLNAFINELDAQAGKHITIDHATHLRLHAQHVIAVLHG